ncbi:MAG TPA: CHASE3 domain-containing protein [Roseiflexaceae bacterium]|nr:CHASE3 domain-containing protein [Roseiflexaceae bacterium]
MPRGDERQITFRVALALTLLLIVGVISYQTTLKLKDADMREAQVEEAIQTLEAIASQLKDTQISHHSYLITGDDQHLQPHSTMLQALEQNLQALRALIAHHPSQQNKIDMLTPLIEANYAEMDRVNDVRKHQGLQAAARMIAIPESQRRTENILQLIGSLEDEQKQLLRHEMEEVEIPAALLLSITFGSCFAIILASFVIIRDIVERAQAYQMLERRVEERTHEIERRRQVAEGLRETLTILNSNRPLDEILDSIVIQACQLLSTDAGAVYRLEEQEGLLSIQAARGLNAEDATLSIPVGWGAMGQVVLTRKPIAVAPVIADPPGETDTTLEAELRAYLACPYKRYSTLLAVPLIVKDAVYGAIALYSCQPREFSREEIEIGVAFSDQAALAIENARLRIQAQQTAVAAERSRLARDLHDAVTQTLFSTSLIADVLPRLWERNAAEALARLNELRQLTRGALAEMRTLLLELRPATLTEVGLGELLRQLAEATISRARVQVDLKIEGQCRLPPDVQLALYRIAQEALNNVARHAGASQAAVLLSCQPEQLELRISDDGQGFDPAGVGRDHLGLCIMRERAEAIGALLRLDSQPGCGTRVMVSWPDTSAVPDGIRHLTPHSTFAGGKYD